MVLCRWSHHHHRQLTRKALFSGSMVQWGKPSLSWNPGSVAYYIFSLRHIILPSIKWTGPWPWFPSLLVPNLRSSGNTFRESPNAGPSSANFAAHRQGLHISSSIHPLWIKDSNSNFKGALRCTRCFLPNQPQRQVSYSLSSPFCRWGNWGSTETTSTETYGLSMGCGECMLHPLSGGLPCNLHLGVERC